MVANEVGGIVGVRSRRLGIWCTSPTFIISARSASCQWSKISESRRDGHIAAASFTFFAAKILSMWISRRFIFPNAKWKILFLTRMQVLVHVHRFLRP